MKGVERERKREKERERIGKRRAFMQIGHPIGPGGSIDAVPVCRMN